MINGIKKAFHYIIPIISKTFVMSFIILITIMLFTWKRFPKFKINLIHYEKISQDSAIYYLDLNNDNKSECIKVYNTDKNKLAFYITSEKGKVLDQWNFKGKPLDSTIEFYHQDIDNDGLSEIFTFSQYGDSLYLYCFCPYTDFQYTKPISNINKIGNKFSCTFTPIFQDTNNDGVQEIIFAIMTGLELHPRYLCSVDIKNDLLYLSKTNNIFLQNPFIFKINNEGTPEFSCDCNAYGNSNTKEGFSDHFCWIMVFDSEMNFKFPPIKIGEYPSTLNVDYKTINNVPYLFCLMINHGNNENPCKILKIDSDGNIINFREFPFSRNWNSVTIFHNSNDLFIIKGNGEILKIGNDLKFLPYKKLPCKVKLPYKTLDIDGDNNNELIFFSQTGDQLLITTKNFTNICSIVLEGEGPFYLSRMTDKKNYQLVIKNKNFIKFYSYYKNPYSSKKLLIFTGIYILILGLFSLIKYSQKYILEQRFISKKQITELQLKSIKNQINPHFTFNILNSIGELYSKQDVEAANYIFGKYCKLLRQSIISSGEFTISIMNELIYVKNYLELEKFRISQKMNYFFEIDPKVNQNLEIPKMLIFIFVENAIKHGIRHANHTGIINIKLFNNKNEYQIAITDNGIGRKKAKVIRVGSTGKGLEILDQILELYHTLSGSMISYEIIDLYKDEKPAGTKVKVNIPLKMRNKWKKFLV